MGQKKPSVRTTSRGQKVMHHPPTDRLGEREVLLPGQSKLIAYLEELQEQLRAAHDELKQERAERVRRKRERMAAEPGPVPEDKRAL